MPRGVFPHHPRRSFLGRSQDGNEQGRVVRTNRLGPSGWDSSVPGVSFGSVVFEPKMCVDRRPGLFPQPNMPCRSTPSHSPSRLPTRRGLAVDEPLTPPSSLNGFHSSGLQASPGAPDRLFSRRPNKIDTCYARLPSGAGTPTSSSFHLSRLGPIRSGAGASSSLKTAATGTPVRLSSWSCCIARSPRPVEQMKTPQYDRKTRWTTNPNAEFRIRRADMVKEWPRVPSPSRSPSSSNAG